MLGDTRDLLIQRIGEAQEPRQAPDRLLQAELGGHGGGGGFNGDAQVHRGDGPVGVLQAVAGERADDGLAAAIGDAATLSRPATDAAEAGSQNTDSSVGQEPVGVEDLVVGDGADAAARLVAAAPMAPYHDAGLPMRMAVAIVSGCSTRVARDDAAPRRRPGSPSMRGSRVARPASWYSR